MHSFTGQLQLLVNLVLFIVKEDFTIQMQIMDILLKTQELIMTIEKLKEIAYILIEIKTTHLHLTILR